LRREIIATQVVNQMVNLSGISYDHRMTEETGSGVAEVTRGWVAAREIIGVDNLWDEIEAVPEQVQMQTRIELFLECRRMNERSSLWLLRHRHPPFDIGAAVEYFKPGMTELATGLGPCIKGRMGEVLASREASWLAAGVPEGLAERSVVWGLLHTGFDLVELANANGISPIEAAKAYWGVYAELDLLWLWDGIGALPRSDRWESQARSALRDDLLSAIASLTGIVLRSSDGSVDTWTANNHRSVARVQAMYREIRRAEKLDVTNLSVALRQLRNLALTSVRPT
jgi:glutamate dehydrogenase